MATNYFGISRRSPAGRYPLWQLLQPHPSAELGPSEETSWWTNDQTQKDRNLRKWDVSRNPIEQEDKLTRAEAPPNVYTRRREDLYAREMAAAAGHPDPVMRDAYTKAVAGEKLRGLERNIKTAVNYETVQNFRDFILGRGRPEDYQRVGWINPQNKSQKLPFLAPYTYLGV